MNTVLQEIAKSVSGQWVPHKNGLLCLPDNCDDHILLEQTAEDEAVMWYVSVEDEEQKTVRQRYRIYPNGTYAEIQ